MRVAYISGAAIPSYTANSIHVMKMCQAILQEGHHVTLFAPRGRAERSLSSVDLWRHYGIESRFPVIWLPAPGRLGHLIYAVLATHRCRSMGVELVFARHLSAAAIGARCGLPVVFEMHEIPSSLSGRLQLRLLLGSKHLKRVVVITEALKGLLLSAYPARLAAERVLVAPDGVDLERFRNLPSSLDARRRLGLRAEGIIAGYVGHLYRGRGIGLILELAQCFPDVLFLLVGGCPADVEFWRQKANGLELPNVLFSGFVPNRDVPLYLAACDILLMPYERSVSVSGGGDTAKWMSPMKMFEYMASGRLIIASDLPVLREVLDGSNALFAAPGDVKAWAEALDRAAADDALRAQLSARAREDARRYTWRRRAARCLDFQGLDMER